MFKRCDNCRSVIPNAWSVCFYNTHFPDLEKCKKCGNILPTKDISEETMMSDIILEIECPYCKESNLRYRDDILAGNIEEEYDFFCEYCRKYFAVDKREHL